MHIGLRFSRSLAVLIAAVALSASACSSTSSKAAPPTSRPTTTSPTTTTEAPTTTVQPTPLPPGTHTLADFQENLLPAGIYLAPAFKVPFFFKTTGEWNSFYDQSDATFLSRGESGAGAVLDPGHVAEVAVTNGFLAGTTPREALTQACLNGTVNFGSPTKSVLMGSPAVQVEGKVAVECDPPVEVSGTLVIPAGYTYRAIAATVNGTIVVVLADASNAYWQTFRPELDALIASMKIAP
jgi:hypothetical protein